MKRLRILIVGGGIAGLATARALEQRGFRPRIVERVPEWPETGTGMYIPANGFRALKALELDGAVGSRALVITRQRLLNHRGSVLHEVDLKDVWGACGPCLAVLRRDLHRTLLAGASGVPLRMGTPIESIHQQDGATTATLGDGSSADFDLIVGADGMHSSVRRLAFGGQEPRYLGQVSWRFLVHGFPEIDAWTVMLGKGKTFLTIPLGQGRVYCYCDIASPRTDDPTGGDLGRLRQLFGDFAHPVPRILDSIEPTLGAYFSPIEEIFQEQSVRSRVVLIGDAAHGMLPNMAEGASLAVEDAVVLAESITAQRPLGDSLASFALRRAPRVAWVREATHRRDRARALPPAIRNSVLRLGQENLRCELPTARRRTMMMSDDNRRAGSRLVGIDDLGRCLATAFERLELKAEDADALANLLIDSELRGHPDHGIAAIGVLADFYREGKLNPRPAVRVLRESDGAILLDGDRGAGPGAPTRAMRWCIERAREEKGMAVAAVRDWQLIAAAPFARLAAEAGLIGFACTNFVPVVAPPGGRTAVFGTNPMAYAIPAQRHAPVVLDIATTVGNVLKVRMAAQEGRRVPDGVILDRSGRTTTDPGEFLEGGLMAPLGFPIAPHKGFGLGLLIDVLSGVLTGSGFAQGMATGAPGNFLWALDVEAFLPREEFLKRMDSQLDQIKQGERLPGVDELVVPGERGHRRYLELTAREVVPVAPLGWEVLVTSCDSLEVPLPAVRERPNP